MNFLDQINQMAFLTLIILSIVIEFKKIKYINWVLYGCVAIIFLTSLVQRLPLNDTVMWLVYLGLVFSIFINTSKFGMRYKRMLKTILGNWLYVAHVILAMILVIISIKFQELMPSMTLIVLIMAYIDFKNYKKEH